MRGIPTALWLNRAGRHGEFEKQFLDESRICLTCGGLNHDLSKVDTKPDLAELLRKVYPSASKGRMRQNLGQIWQFAQEMKPGDWVVLPSKMKAAIHVGEITGPYKFDGKAEDPFFHFRTVKWLETDIPRTNFDKDILLSLGAFSTICQVKRNDAEKRVRAMATTAWKSTGTTKNGTKSQTDGEGNGEDEDDGVDLELAARDRIARLIERRYKGHGMAVLVDAILKAQGYTIRRFAAQRGQTRASTFLPPQGPWDLGVRASRFR